MDIYRFANAAIIDEVSVVSTENGSKRAYLHAVEGAPKAKLEDIKEKLTLSGWQCIPASFQGKPALEVRGFGKDDALLRILKQHNFCSEIPVKTVHSKSTASWWEMLKKRSLQASGIFYLAGDAAYTAYGYKESHWEDMLAGVFYFGGSATLMAFGQNDQADIQIHDLAKEMRKHAMLASVQLPESCSLATITHDREKGVLQNAEDIFRRYPAEIMNAFFAMAGMCIATSALRHRVFAPPVPHADKMERLSAKIAANLDVGLGSLTTAAGAISALVKEKKHDPDEPEATGMNRVYEWIQERPLRVAGYGYIASTLCHAGSTALEMWVAKRHHDTRRLSSIPFRAGFVGANLIAEYLMSISSKGHGEGITSDDSVKESMYAIAAELLLKQPANIQEAQLRHMLNFLEHPTVLAEKRKLVEQKLREQMALQQKNPWLCMDKEPEIMAQASKKTPTVPARLTWREKIIPPSTYAALKAYNL